MVLDGHVSYQKLGQTVVVVARNLGAGMVDLQNWNVRLVLCSHSLSIDSFFYSPLGNRE